MPRLDLIVVPGVALLAGIVIGALLYRVGATDAVGAMLVAGFITIVASYCDLILDRTAERARTQAAHHQIRSDAELTRRAVIELKHHIDTGIASRNDRMASEVRVLEALVRKLAEGIAERAKGIASPDGTAALTVSSAPHDDITLEVVRRSLEENRIDLYLQPVVSLPQRKIRFYEALTRLRTEDGTIIMPSQYIHVAEPAGLMSVVDNVLLFRCIQILGSLNHRKDIGVFCNLSRETLQDSMFFGQFIEFMKQHRELAGSLIFEISQETMTEGTPAEIANLSQLADLDFTFSVDKITTLDIDFASARARHVRYFKVPARLLLDTKDAGGRVHPSDLKELLARFGMNLIAERVENERDVIRLLDHDVDYGQGFLFGEPQQIKDTMLTQRAPRPVPAAAPQQRLRAVAGRSA